jgi:hypothetical protein
MKTFVVATLVALAAAQANDFYDLDDDFNGSTATTTSDGWGVTDTTPADPTPAADPNDEVDPNDVTPAVEPTPVPTTDPVAPEPLPAPTPVVEPTEVHDWPTDAGATLQDHQGHFFNKCEDGIVVTVYDLTGHPLGKTRDIDVTEWPVMETMVVPDVNISSSSKTFLNTGRNEYVGAKWDGYVYIPYAGEWTFGSDSDDGSYIFIDGVEVVDNHGGHGMPHEKKGTISLEKGMHSFVGTWEQGVSFWGIQFKYGGPLTPYGLIPGTAFKHNCDAKPQVPVSEWCDLEWTPIINSIIGDMAWIDFANTLQDEAHLESLAIEIADGLVDDFLACKQPLPEVCESGQACRQAIYADAQIALRHEWLTTLQRVSNKMTDGWLESRVTLESAFKEEFLCDDGCYCEEIEGTYTDHILLQREIEKDIIDLQVDVKKLYEK